MQGLPNSIRKRLCNTQDGLNTDEYEKVNFDKLLEKTLEMAKGSRRLYRISNRPIKRERLSHFADLCDAEPKWESQASDEDFFVAPVVPAIHNSIVASSTPNSTQARKFQDDSMALLTKKFDALALSLKAQFGRETNAMREAHISSAYAQPPQQFMPGPVAPTQPMNPNAYTRPNTFRPTTDLCNYCTEPGHLRRACQTLQQDIEQGLCHKDEKGFICLGRYSPGARPIRMMPGQSQRQSVMASQNLRTPPGNPNPTVPNRPNGSVNTVRVGTAEAIEISSDEEELDEEELDDEEEDEEELDDRDRFANAYGRIAAASATPPQTPQTPALPTGTRSILKRKALAEENLATPKTARYGTWEPAIAVDEDAEMSDAPEPSQKAKPREKWKGVHFSETVETQAPRPPPDRQSNTAAGRTQKPNTEKPRTESTPRARTSAHPPAISPTVDQGTQTDSSLEIEEIFMGILREGKVSISFESLLTLSPSFTKFLRGLTTRHRSRSSTPPAENVARVSSIESSRRDERLYVANTPRAKVRLNGEFCKALIDTGAEINVMTEEIRERLDLPIRLDPALRLVSHSGHERNFIGVCEDVDVTIGGVTTQQHIFVVDSADHVLVLGIPFMIKARARMDWDANGHLIMTCYSSDDSRTAISKVLDRYQSPGPTEQDLFPSNSLNSRTVIMPG